MFNEMPRSLRLLSGLALILVIALIAISSYIRLSHSGLGCQIWPQCYARIGQPISSSALNQSQTPGPQVQQPRAWAQPVHRLIASVLGVVIIGLLANAWMMRNHWQGGNRCLIIALVLFALTLGLALLGYYSGQLHNPAIVMGNLCGGMLMLVLLSGLFLSGTVKPVEGLFHSRLRRSAWVVLALIMAQIVLGGLTGANFAAASCNTFPDCHGQWLPSEHLLQAFDLNRPVSVNSGGYALGGAERQAIHLAHRTFAWLLSIATLLLALSVWRRGMRTVAVILVLLLAAEVTVGITAIYMQLPIILAVAHNWLAGLMLLSTLWLLALSRKTDEI